MSEMQKKNWVTDFVSEKKRVENFPDFEKLAHGNSAWFTGFIVKNFEMSKRRLTILITFCLSASVA